MVSLLDKSFLCEWGLIKYWKIQLIQLFVLCRYVLIMLVHGASLVTWIIHRSELGVLMIHLKMITHWTELCKGRGGGVFSVQPHHSLWIYSNHTATLEKYSTLLYGQIVLETSIFHCSGAISCSEWHWTINQTCFISIFDAKTKSVTNQLLFLL